MAGENQKRSGREYFALEPEKTFQLGEIGSPASGYRVIGINTLEKKEWLVGDYADLDAAREAAESICDVTMMVAHVYDADGRIVSLHASGEGTGI